MENLHLLQLLLILAGVFHFFLLPLSLSLPKIVNLREELGKLNPFVAQIMWVYAGYILLMIIVCGVLSFFVARPLLEGETLAIAVGVFLAVFWTLRLGLAVFFYHPREYLTGWVRQLGYRMLTVLFAYWVIVYWTAVWWGVSARWA